jgi:60 kDa SS-A/Ro ribonucleoprotein
MRYGKLFATRRTPQSVPLPDSGQVMNSAGGFAWPVDAWTRLRRFLILGSEGGSYYATERALTLENARAVQLCIAEEGERVVREIVEISDAGRAPKNDAALFALAMCAGLGDIGTRRAAFAALPAVARIGTHLFLFAEAVEGFRGWGRGLRGAVGDWYGAMRSDRLAAQVTKYRQRSGWSHRDLLRLAHPITPDETRNAIYRWVVDGWDEVPAEAPSDPAIRTLWAFERLQRAASSEEAAAIVREFDLPMEAVPTEHRGLAVWEALAPRSGLTFLFRNLGNMSKAGLLVEENPEAVRLVAERLTDRELLRRARIHPIQALASLTVYRQGRGARGHGEWPVVPEIVAALESAFYATFGNVEATGKRWVLALDVSGSMASGEIAGVPGLTPRAGSAAMAMVTYRTEPSVELVAFQERMVRLEIGRDERLDFVVNAVSNLPFGRTDCAQPMLWALKHRVRADVFVIYTDSETWYGDVHPARALQQYRKEMEIPARLVVVGMVSNGFTIADPNDGGMLDVVGFDTAAPDVIRQFAAGSL